jgi:hypothetical protein
MKYTLVALLTLTVGFSHSQMSSNFNSSRNWSMNKKEIFFSIGATQFLGDLGGRDQIGTQKSLIDIDWNMTRMGLGAGYRFRFHPMWAWSTQLYAGMLRGDDANTNEIVRRSRNLHFRSPIVEWSNRIECIVYANERVGARYKIQGLKGFRTSSEVVYLFTGISGIFFNPQMQINGTWTNLQPLRTEGQGLPGGVDEYSRVTVAIPFGVGFKIGIGQYWRVGMEFIYNKTFTDYMDDVSTNYYDPNVLAAQVGPDAAFASNPAIENHNWFAPGQQRGNPDDNDAYFFTNIVLTRNITYPKPRGGSRIRWSGRTKF